MQIKVAYVFDDLEYIAFVDKLPMISGFGKSEEEAILHLLKQALNEDGFNKSVIKNLINKIENK